MSESSTDVQVLQLHADDNCWIAVRPLAAGQRVTAGGQTICVTEPIGQGHKLASRPIAAGTPILKFGQIIGFATRAVDAGSHLHSHNLEARSFERDYRPASAIPSDLPPLEGYTFEGYRRADGRVGTRNYLAIISSVNCSASVSKYVARLFPKDSLSEYPHVDGVVAFTHGTGCGMHYGSEHHQILSRTLGGIARHPNIGGYLLIGLGCETGTLGHLIDDQHLVQIATPGQNGGSAGRDFAEGEPPVVLVMQEIGGTAKTIERAAAEVRRLLPQVNAFRRETVPASKLVLGTNCGGSDGNAGVTANPALGAASDRVVAAGGTVILGETTEIYGAEQLLISRARTTAVATKLLDRIRWWEEYTAKFGSVIDNNPSPGNKAGGLTTIYEKSLGAVSKAGTTALEDVYLYAEQVTAKGMVVMDTPGLDPVSVTGIVAGGANVVVFTTGRGSCFGCKPTPSIKVATNTAMFQRLRDDMDLDAGTILTGRLVDEVGDEIFRMILEVASGRPTASERLGLGDEEFVPWNLGPTL